jgi:hypothetical protein
MTIRFKLQTRIKIDWQKYPNIVHSCLLILDNLLFGDWDLDNISFADLRVYCESDEDVARIIMYATGDRAHLLDVKMYFQDGDTSIMYFAASDQIKQSRGIA